jgi:HAD superfamily hydrolase (TIGR01509 family)
MAQTILFDLGGVFIDVHIEKGISALQKRLVSVSDETIRRIVLNPHLLNLYERGKIGSEVFHAEVMRQLGRNVPFDIFRQVWQDIFTPNEPMIGFLKYLRGEFKLVALSNTNELHIRHLSECYDFMNCFDHHVYSYETGLMKPEPEIYQKALDVAGAKAEASLFVDDLQSNIEAALALGIPAFHFTGNAAFFQFWEKRFPTV